MNEYLEGAWKQMEMEVEAELEREKVKSEENDEMYSQVGEEGKYGSDSAVNLTSNDTNEDNTEESGGLKKTVRNQWISDALLPLDSGFMIKRSSSRNAKTFIKTP